MKRENVVNAVFMSYWSYPNYQLFVQKYKNDIYFPCCTEMLGGWMNWTFPLLACKHCNTGPGCRS